MIPPIPSTVDYYNTNTYSRISVPQTPFTRNAKLRPNGLLRREHAQYTVEYIPSPQTQYEKYIVEQVFPVNIKYALMLSDLIRRYFTSVFYISMEFPLLSRVGQKTEPRPTTPLRGS